jgi:hypothetical protein
MHNHNTKNNTGSINGQLLWKVMKFNYHNPSLGLATKVRACKGAGQQWSPIVKFHAPENVGKCEGMNPYIPNGLANFKGWFQRSKLIVLKSSLYHWKDPRT